jgi:hypothetical protein
MMIPIFLALKFTKLRSLMHDRLRVDHAAIGTYYIPILPVKYEQTLIGVIARRAAFPLLDLMRRR